jgi:cobalt-precorrin 5A hydrolase
MNLAIIAVTDRGAKLAQTIKIYFSADVFVKSGRNPIGEINEYFSLRDLINNIFQKYDAFIFIMATGIVVRVIAPLIVHKSVDPAILVMNESGKHVISLLSGHIGGANELACLVAEKIHAEPIITTATDVNEKIAADIIATKLNLMIYPFESLKYINAEIAKGELVEIYLDLSIKNINFYKEKLQRLNLSFKLSDLNKEKQIYDHLAIIITSQDLDITPRQLLLKPRSVSIGIGCRRNTSKDDILQAIYEACSIADVSSDTIINMASTIVKSDEVGLLMAAQALEVPILFYENSQLQEVIDKYNVSVSNFVNEQIGVGNICEAAALLISQSKKIVLHKTKFNKVTVAITWAK